MKEPCLLIGDIGGTNARFAIAEPELPGFSREITLACGDFDSANSAIREYLDRAGLPDPDIICFAAAGPIVDGRVRFTNNHWSLDVRELQGSFNARDTRLLNDFEAIAYSIPNLGGEDCMPIGLPAPIELSDSDFTVGIIGPGTGLGGVGLCRRNSLLFPIVGEAGHTGFAPESRVQVDILNALRERFDRVSDERLVSGPGLENLYWALARLHGESVASIPAAQICQLAEDKQDPRAVEALHLFFEILGQVAGNMALVLGARQGMFIAGGIAQRYPAMLLGSGFRAAFEAKGRHRSLMEKIPTQLVRHPQPGLLGASFMARQMKRDAG